MFSSSTNIFVDLYTNAIRFYHAGGHLYVANNDFRAGVQEQMLLLDHIQIVTASGNIEIRNNTFANAAVTSPEAVPAGMLISGTTGTVTVDSNTFDYCGRGQYRPPSRRCHRLLRQQRETWS